MSSSEASRLFLDLMRLHSLIRVYGACIVGVGITCKNEHFPSRSYEACKGNVIMTVCSSCCMDLRTGEVKEECKEAHRHVTPNHPQCLTYNTLRSTGPFAAFSVEQRAQMVIDMHQPIFVLDSSTPLYAARVHGKWVCPSCCMKNSHERTVHCLKEHDHRCDAPCDTRALVETFDTWNPHAAL